MSEQHAQLSAHVKDSLDRLEHVGQVQEALLHYAVQVVVVQDSELFKVTRCLDSLTEFLPLRAKHVDLEIVVQVVDQEAHVLAELE